MTTTESATTDWLVDSDPLHPLAGHGQPHRHAQDGGGGRAIALVKERRGADGRWLLENSHEEEWVLDLGESEGQPSRWSTLHALRVLRHFNSE